MAKKSTLVSMALTLFVACFSASAILGGVYVLTKEPIDIAQTLKINEAIAVVVPKFDNDPSKEKFTKDYGGKTYTIYPAKERGDIVGYAIESSVGGYGGPISLMIGFEIGGTIFNTSVLSHTETPGLGDKIEVSKGDFSLQFVGKSPESFKLSVKKAGGDVDAITASTISSTAFCTAVANAWEVFKLCKSNQ